jgi:ribosomal-protein-alanine N-acetyltransferase
MSALAILSGRRVCLRRWRDKDRDAFAAMNSDARVMELFRNSLSWADSDAMLDRIQKHFGEHGLPEGHPLRRHVLYRLGADSYAGMC